MASKELDNVVKSAAIVGTTLLGAHFAPELLDIASDIPQSLTVAGQAIRNSSEKVYALAGLAVAYGLAKMNKRSPRVQLNKLEGLVAGSATFATALVAGDMIARQIPSLPTTMQSIYGEAYTLGGIAVGTGLALLSTSKKELAKDIIRKTGELWDKVKEYSTKTLSRKIMASVVALGIIAYPFLSETTKAMIDPRNLGSDYALVSGPPVGTADETRKWIYETYKHDLIAAEKKTGIDKFKHKPDSHPKNRDKINWNINVN